MALFRKLPNSAASFLVLILSVTVSQASPTLVVDVDSGDVVYQDAATIPWYPASTTKLMTVYVALSAVKEGRITLDTPMMVSPRAAAMAPSKMGFRPGTLVTLDNALKMLMVKSPNDVAVTIAEGISGSVESFADDMNVYAARLGLHESHFVNPNGLPDDRHVSSARDMAMIGRALLKDFPEQQGLFGIGALSFGRQLINNHNGLLGRYPGAFGMKTGYTCAAGYNVVASAERNGRRLITVIMGAPSNGEKNEKAAALFDRYFSANAPSLGTLDSLPPSGVTTPPNNRDVICGRGRGAAIAEANAEDNAMNGPEGSQGGSHLLPVRTAFEPVPVFVGPAPGWSGRVAQAVGAGAKELNPAPVRTSAAEPGVRPIEKPSTAGDGGAVEAAAPAPMALLGATSQAPAALATKRFVRATPSLSLRVGAAKQRITTRLLNGTTKPSGLGKVATTAKLDSPDAAKAKEPAAKRVPTAARTRGKDTAHAKDTPRDKHAKAAKAAAAAKP